MRSTETLLYWLTVAAYAGTFILAVIGAASRRQRLEHAVRYALAAAFSLHSASLALRWLGSGRLPFIAFFEAVSSACWVSVLATLVVMQYRPRLQRSALGVLPVVFLLLGWAGSPSYTEGALSANLQSAWLFVHATFATLGKGAFIAAAGVAALWLWKRHRDPGAAPTAAEIDDTFFRIVSAGFLFYTVMLVSGAIWAHQAWGRYWGWDPVETGCLITWFVYAAFLHLRFTFPRLRGSLAAWYVIVAALLTTFLLWAIARLFPTVHAYG